MKRSLSSLITDTNVREFKAIEIEISAIKKSDTQARTNFDKGKLLELSHSIVKNGILQPLIVQIFIVKCSEEQLSHYLK